MRALLLFARSPEVEARAKRLPGEAVEAIFSEIARSWAEVATTAGARLILSCETRSEGQLRKVLSEAAPLFLRQTGATFGQRLAGSVEQAFDIGITALLVAGIDTPPPPPQHIAHAFARLEGGGAAAVIGPASDGGVYLFGLARPERPLLERIEPRQRDVVQTCREYFGPSTVFLPIASDLDTITDLYRLARNAPGEEPWLPFRTLLRLATRFLWSDEAPVAFALPLFRGRELSRAPPSSARLAF